MRKQRRRLWEELSASTRRAEIHLPFMGPQRGPASSAAPGPSSHDPAVKPKVHTHTL